MKKVILVSLMSSIVSAAAFAGAGTQAQGPEAGTVDSTSATLSWEADVPVIIPGAWVTFTGEGGSMTLNSGDLNVQANGTFSSTPIKLELHTYDEPTNTPGELIVVGEDQFNGSKVENIHYSVTAPTFSSLKGTDVSNVIAKVSMNEAEVATDAKIESDKAETTWSIAGSDVASMVGGDTVTATAVVRADVAFAAM
ncbi:hypothetical protein [Vibrio campbellii]|uniref:Uncharacterized protein n=1 Tax=Vibrio campbellii (strain ATCC BAA-1116) TaxID=2902295 RepID=A7MTJ0_VIBC1|nr:hypothetical protein [Vibrio campbellii]ABU70619.1 hypothetical protein VIBHAR_01650 [Vibrio campbellii ATCC BAA-1116]AGU96349.1 hypothetical protein M892_04880 [Vibrio campbellii ATCC BAA-1116]MBT0124086.1 hypothetical protein [Vibrio campbellii]MBT0139038.1 hypothetical protein [Vibrio campbellii]MBT0143727.1 hypothetical protein [Vibrio campbellii]